MQRQLTILPAGLPFVHTIADKIIGFVRQTVAQHGGCSIALAGGNTPRAIYQRIEQQTSQDRDLWQAVDFFWGDERTVPPEHCDSNYRLAFDAWLGPAGVPANRLHRMRAEQPDLVTEAQRYEQEIARAIPRRLDGFPVLDLVLLGMGDDGHTASLFPGTTALCVTDHSVVENQVPQMKTWRLTMTFPLINRAGQIWFIVAGESKAERIREIVSPTAAGSVPYPCQFVEPVAGEMHWFLDQPAAALVGHL